MENGTAPLLAFPHMKKFRKKKVTAMIAGYNVAVKNAALFHSRPFIVLYNLAEKYPAIKPMNMYSRMEAVVSAPLDAGDNIPIIAKTVTKSKHVLPD